MQKKTIIFLLISFSSFLLIIYGFFSFKTYTHKNYYNTLNTLNTLNGIVVTKDNLLSLVESAPKELELKVKNWFSKDNAYEVLVKQRDLLTDVGSCDADCQCFFDAHPQIKNIGGINYVFMLPSSKYIVKISGPSNRFLNSTKELGLDLRAAYFRSIYSKEAPKSIRANTDTNLGFSVSKKNKIYCRYMSFDEDKARIRNYFYHCCPKSLLFAQPNKAQLKELAYQVSGAMAQKNLAGVAEYNIQDKYINNKNYRPDNLKEAFEQFLDAAFEAIESLCYKKKNLLNKPFLDTYNTASRMFHMYRFNEAIDKFNLVRLQKPPKSYLVNLNKNKQNSCADKDVVFVQEILQNCKSIEFFMQNNPHKIEEIFTYTAMCQLLKALSYAGLWDINCDNIFVNIKNNKILYMDFEHDRRVSHKELFNGTQEKVTRCLHKLLIGFVGLFKTFPRQLRAISHFVDENNIDLNTYVQQKNTRAKKMTRNFQHFSHLGFAVSYDDTECKGLIRLKHSISRNLTSSINNYDENVDK